MKPIVIKQTVEYTSGMFKGEREALYVRVYTKRELSQCLGGQIQHNGSNYKLLKTEIVKNTNFTRNEN